MIGGFTMKLQIKDIKMYYEITGNEDGPWLVLIHGLAGTTKCWKNQLDTFNKYYRVLNLELAGHGDSDGSKAKKYSPEIAANHIRLLMNELNIEKAYMLGLSLGTIVQQYFCELFPEKVIATIYASPVTKFNFTSACFNKISDVLFLKLFPKDMYLKLMAHLMLPGDIHKKSRKFFAQETLRMKDKEYLKWWRIVMEGNHYDYLNINKLPALIIAGKKDFCFYKDALLLKKKYPYCKLVTIENAGHVTIFQEPKKFNDIVVNYINNMESNINSYKTSVI